MSNVNIKYKHQDLGELHGCYAVIRNISIKPQDNDLDVLKQEALTKVLALNEQYIQEHPTNLGYKELLSKFGKGDMTPAGQHVVQMMRKREKFPIINTAVDAYNIMVTESFLAVGAHDLNAIKGDIVFNYVEEGELIPAVNMTDAFRVDKGDYVYRDDEKILAWLDVRDTDLAKITNDTQSIILIVEGNERTSREYIAQHLQKACELITRFNGGDYAIYDLLNSHLLQSI